MGDVQPGPVVRRAMALYQDDVGAPRAAARLDASWSGRQIKG
jgi:hypothetical protein